MEETPTTDWKWLLGLGLVVIGAVYLRAVTFGHMSGYDDYYYLFGRPEVKDWWSASWRRRLMTEGVGYWMPVPTFIYAHLRLLFGEQYVHAVHAFNIGVHLVNVWLVFSLVRRWADVRVGVLVALLWGIHPVQVESVAWVTNTKNVLFATGTLSGLLIWERHLDGEGRFDSLAFTAGTISVIFLLTLGCRPEAALFPMLLVATLVRREVSLEMVRGAAIVVAVPVVVAGLYVPYVVSGYDDVVTGMIQENTVRGRYVCVTRAFEETVRHFVFPFDLEPAYFLRSDVTLVDTLPGAFAILTLTALLAVLLLKRLRGLLFPLVFALVAYAPYSQVFAVPRLTADTYLYLPSIGGILFVVRALERLAERRSKEKGGEASGRLKQGFVIAVIVVFAGLGAVTHFQVGRWRNPITLWRPVLAKSPKVWRPYAHLAEEHMERGNWERSAAILDTGMDVFRRSHKYPSFMPMVYEKVGRPDKALAIAVEALKRDRSVEPFQYQVFLGLLARHGFALRDGRELEGLVEKAVDVMTSNERWMQDRRQRLPLAAYFVRHERPDLARPFLARELASKEPHCAAWELVESLPKAKRRELTEQGPPARCRR